MLRRQLLRLMGVVGLLFTMAGTSNAALQAQTTNQWSPQQRIPEYDNESRPPYLVADQNRTVHVFNTQAVESGSIDEAIYYRQWTLERGWTSPVDIILSPEAGSPIVQGAYLDQSGVMHLILFAGNERDGSIYYSSAPAADAGQASAWSLPVEVGPSAGPLASAALTGDGQGNLFVVYGGRVEGSGLYATHSSDGGKTWSAPHAVYLSYAGDLWPSGLRIALDSQGRLHAVWSMVNQFGIDQAIYYARLEADHTNWSNPFLIAQRLDTDYKAAWPAIISYDDLLITVYQKSNPATREMRLSHDGGQTWSDPVQPWPQYVGEYENAVLVIDGQHQLHILEAYRLSGTDCCYGMFDATWLGDHWSDLEPIVQGPKTLQFDPSAPNAVVSQGNVILTTWWTDTGGGPRNGVWYSYVVLDAPELPVVPLPGSAYRPIPTATTEPATPTPAVTLQVAAPDIDSTVLPAMTSPALPLEVGLVPLAALIAIVIFAKRIRS